MIQFYFHVRKLSKDMSGESETELPLQVGNNVAVEVGDCINLSGFGDPRDLFMGLLRFAHACAISGLCD